MNKWLPRVCLLTSLCLIPVLACNMSDPTATGDGPTVSIIYTLDGSTVVVGQQVLIQSSSTDERGISHVELIVNAVPTRADPPVDGVPTVFAIAQPWFPQTPGKMLVQVVAYNVTGQKSPPASITLHVVDQAVGGTPPATAPPPTLVPDVTAESGCTLNASYVEDVTIPDGSVLQPGIGFIKTWRIRNSGTCDWGDGYVLVFVNGDQMDTPSPIPVPATVAGATVDVPAPMVSPAAPGTYKGNWRMRSDEGQVFGSTVWVLIKVPSPVTDTPEATGTSEPTDTPEATETPPAAPTTLVKSTLPSGYVSFVWVDNADDEEGFHILADGDVYESIAADAEGWGFLIGEHLCGDTVQISIVAYKKDAWSDPSNAVAYDPPPCPPPTVAEATGLVLPKPTYIDLDTGSIGDFDANTDFLWQASGGDRVIGMNSMRFADLGLGPRVPLHHSCSEATRNESSIYVPALAAGTRLCFDTTDGNLAGVRVDEIQPDGDLVISFITWEGP
jgi:hypothetical protein